MDKRAEDIFIKYLEKAKFFPGSPLAGAGGGFKPAQNTPKPAATTPPAGTTPKPAAQGSLGNAPKAPIGKKTQFAAQQGAKKVGGFGKKIEGGILGALGAMGRETRGFVRAKAGASQYDPRDSTDPGQGVESGQTAEQAETFQQQVNRSKGGGPTARERRQVDRAYKRASMSKKSFNPALASLLAVSAGFAASDAVVNASGARGARSITDDQLNLFNVMANKRRGKKLRKEHSPLPPIQGLVWDEGAKRWRKPENVGKTASEVQGKKRIRGSALGQTAKTPGGTSAGKGRGRGYSRGRAQRIATGDIGVAGVPGSNKASKKRRRRK
jgi:hypothetical protein